MILQKKNPDNSRKQDLTDRGKNSKLRTKTQGFDKVKNTVYRKLLPEKKPVLLTNVIFDDISGKFIVR